MRDHLGLKPGSEVELELAEDGRVFLKTHGQAPESRFARLRGSAKLGLTTDELAADADRNREFLRPFLSGEAPVSYAFPFGRVSPRTKRFYAQRFSNLRGVHPGINAGRVDLAQLNTVSLEVRCWPWRLLPVQPLPRSARKLRNRRARRRRLPALPSRRRWTRSTPN